MEVLSRVEKSKAAKQKKTPPMGWLAWFLSYGVIVFLTFQYVHIPEMIDFRQTLEIGLFFSSIMFLDLYLLAFTFVSTKKFVQTSEKVARAKIYIVVAWAVSIFYHFGLWLSGQSMLDSMFYYLGMFFTMAVFFLTLAHFLSYFSFVKKDHTAQLKKRYLENRREAYEVLKRIYYMYHVIQDTMEKDPEVKQMMKWNLFDRKMESLLAEIEAYIHSSSFTKEDLEKILGVKAWMDNLLMIIEQHPLHKNLFQKYDF